MSICVYGEIGFDWLVEDVSKIHHRWGGAGLYAALAAAKQGLPTCLLTVYGPELPDYAQASWEDIGVSLKFSQYSPVYSLPKYLVTGFSQYGKKRSRPLTAVKLEMMYDPDLPSDCEALLVFPINHSLPPRLLAEAKKRNIPVFLDPKPNERSIADTKNLITFADCLLVNEEEAKKLTNKHDIDEIVNVLKRLGIQQIVIKQGIKGCLVIDGDEEHRVPAYKSRAECTLGSGDVFGGSLVTTYLKTKDLVHSTKFACCVAANFIEQRETEAIITEAATIHDMGIRPVISVPDVSGRSIYLAGPFFSQQELDWVNDVCFALEDAGFRVNSPSRENGIINASTPQNEREEIFQKDIQLLEHSDIVVALLDHNDSGTHFEIGYAYKHGFPVIGFKTSRDSLNNMLQFGCVKVCNSLDCLIEELYGYFRA